jgi:transcriptional regulator with XRE-family HTH domain
MRKQQTDKIRNLSLTTFDAKLRGMAENGAFDEAMNESLDRLLHETEPTELSASELSQFHQTVKKASIESLIMEARRELPVKVLPFGRYLQLIRDRCDLTKTDIAEALNKDQTYIDKIENGQTNPLHLMAKDVADIMQLFKLTLTDLKTTIASFLTLADSKRRKASAMARSSMKAGEKGKEDSLGLAMDAALQAIAIKKGNSCHGNIIIDSDYINAIKKVLKERGKKSLLV